MSKSPVITSCHVIRSLPRDLLLERFGRRLERLARECRNLGIPSFGGSGTTWLRFDDDEGRPLILAHLRTTNVGGGDGGYALADDGYERGE